uniref:MamL-1 domain-containing protein n=1 Tax=Globodera pallida TaxID=36090 RepID=A0A183C8G1_GLOPA
MSTWAIVFVWEWWVDTLTKAECMAPSGPLHGRRSGRQQLIAIGNCRPGCLPPICRPSLSVGGRHVTIPRPLSNSLFVNERSNLDRKQRQLERLRREAERRGLLRGGDTSAPHQNGKQRRQQQKHSPEASVEPVIAENERIPSLPSLPILASTDNSAGKKKLKKETLKIIKI